MYSYQSANMAVSFGVGVALQTAAYLIVSLKAEHGQAQFFGGLFFAVGLATIVASFLMVFREQRS